MPPQAGLSSLRRQLATISKNIVFRIYLDSGYVAARDRMRSRLGRAHAVILCYHRIGLCDRMSRPVEQFRRDLEWLQQRYECLGLAELCRRIQDGGPLRRPAAVITFDDGYRDNFTEAVPLLLTAGLTATFFVTTGYVGTDRVFLHDARSRPSRTAFPLLTWDDLRAMQAAGFEIGSHTVNHVDLGATDSATTFQEVNESLAALNRELGTRPRAFAFPWGQPANVSPEAMIAVKEAGYYAAVTMFGGTNGPGAHPLALHRTDAGNGHLSPLAWRVRATGMDLEKLRRTWNGVDRRRGHDSSGKISPSRRAV